MSETVLSGTIAYSFGQAVIRAIFLDDSILKSASVLKTSQDLSFGMAAVTKLLEKELGSKIMPKEVVITGSSGDLEKLRDFVDAKLVPEPKAISAAEKHISEEMHQPTAILDLGPSAFKDHFPAEEIARWLPFVVNLNDIENYLANKRLFPQAIPTTTHEYEIDLAVARQSIIKLGEKEGLDYFQVGSHINLILTGGMLVSLTSIADLMSLVMDSFYFSSGAKIMVDSKSLLILLGAVWFEFPETKVPDTGLRNIGSILHLPEGANVSVDFGLPEKQRLVLGNDEMLRIPVKEGIAKISVEGDGTHSLEGGEGGIYLDGRNKPLGVVAGSKDSMAKIEGWRRSLKSESLVEEEIT